MGTPTYIVQKVGDQYVPVLKDAHPHVSCMAYAGWGLLLAYMGWNRRGIMGAGAMVGGVALLTRGVLGRNPLRPALDRWRDRARDGRPSQTPSYQNDFFHRAGQLPADVVDEQSMESFPASDPPARSKTLAHL